MLVNDNKPLRSLQTLGARWLVLYKMIGPATYLFVMVMNLMLSN